MGECSRKHLGEEYLLLKTPCLPVSNLLLQNDVTLQIFQQWLYQMLSQETVCLHDSIWCNPNQCLE